MNVILRVTFPVLLLYSVLFSAFCNWGRSLSSFRMVSKQITGESEPLRLSKPIQYAMRGITVPKKSDLEPNH
ncbi:unnamed protein product [Orchesella dallaii]|uniref:Uncharacterized protein n=1 Tax=Orchesella dallaii TaxID=48710 RepID=A0ABP1QM62_9HEXA